jgi:hypothetical protein
MTVTLTTCDGSRAELPQDAHDALVSSLPGRVHTPDSAEFTQACTIWNAMIERRQGLVIRCTGTAEVS